MGGTVFGLHWRKQITILREFGESRLGRSKQGLGRNKKMHFRKKCAKPGEAKRCWDCTGAGGSLFLRSYGNHRNPAQTYITSEGKAYVKD